MDSILASLKSSPMFNREPPSTTSNTTTNTGTANINSGLPITPNNAKKAPTPLRRSMTAPVNPLPSNPLSPPPTLANLSISSSKRNSLSVAKAPVHNNVRSDSMRSYASESGVVDLGKNSENNQSNNGASLMINPNVNYVDPANVLINFNNVNNHPIQTPFSDSAREQNTAVFAAYQLKKTATSLEFANKNNIRKSSLWEPPVSCQRRLSTLSQYQQYFPIELTSRDYYHRVLNLVICVIDHLSIDRLIKYQKNNELGQRLKSHSNLNPLPMVDLDLKTEEFINLVLANIPNQKIIEMTKKLHLLSNINNPQLINLITHNISQLLEVKDFLAHNYLHWDKNCLADDISAVFDSGLALIFALKDFISTNSEKAFPGNSSSDRIISIDYFVAELKDLQNLWKLQKIFQVQKLSYLGWDKNANHHFHQQGNRDERNDETKDEVISYDALMKRYDDLKKEVDFVLTIPSNYSKVMLIIRILTIIEDLTLLSNEMNEMGDHEESSRLRELFNSIDMALPFNDNFVFTVDPKSSQPLDHRKYIDHIYIIKNEIYNLSLDMIQLLEQQKSMIEVSKVLAIEKILNELNDSYHQLLLYTRKVSLVQQTSVMRRINLEGSSFIDSNYLFITEYDDEKMNIASLLIQSESEDLLKSVEAWPGLTLLHSLQPADQGNDTSVNLVASIVSNSMFLSDTDYQSMSEPSQQLVDPSMQFLGSTSPGRSQGQSGFNSSLVLSNNNNYKKEFSQLIYETLKSFESLIQQCDTMLTNEARAHSELICRLIGIRDDLYSLIEVNTHATNHIEADRLMQLVNIIDNTIDADEEDYHSMVQHQQSLIHTYSKQNLKGEAAAVAKDFIANQHIGRGRKRIDNIFQFVKFIVESLNQLNKLKLRAKSINDFIAIKSLDQMMKLLQDRIVKLEESIKAFHLLDNENDISSFGYHGSTSGAVSNQGGVTNLNSMGPPGQTPNLMSSALMTSNHSNAPVILDINERIAREGTDWLTSNFLFSYCCGPRGQSIGSLAIIAGAGAVLRYIKTFWPSFTILGGNNLESVASGPEGSSSADPKSVSNPNNNSNSMPNNQMIDFRNANTLRMLGFDAKSLQLAGFSTIDILTAGYNAEQLREAGFGIDIIRAIPQFDNYLLKAIGYQLETQGNHLVEFFYYTNGPNWKNSLNWKELEAYLKQMKTSHSLTNGGNSVVVPSVDNTNALLPNSKSQQQLILLNILKKLFGVHVTGENSSQNHGGMSIETSSGSSAINQVGTNQSSEITKIILVQNNLQGELILFSSM